ncbi:MAG: hypothetical protein CM1200mP2_49070 [Planctomycetaceae bacterium]|nr:MAG: hypothetical protein CM1200mP2_49070 [Planctomycetaceae bacterium]
MQELTDKIDSDGHRKRNQRGVATKLRLGGHYDRISSRGENATADYRLFRQRLADEILRISVYCGVSGGERFWCLSGRFAPGRFLQTAVPRTNAR